MRETIHAFDRVVGRQVNRLPRWLQLLMELFTLVGQPPFTVGIAAATWGYGWALGKPFYMIAGMIAIMTIAASGIIKIILHRSRPMNAYVEKMFFKTYSFPSGHATGALVSYGLAAIVITNKWPELALAVWGAAIALTFLVSLSRIYLGAHYTSDIIGGWIVGGVGLTLILIV